MANSQSCHTACNCFATASQNSTHSLERFRIRGTAFSVLIDRSIRNDKFILHSASSTPSASFIEDVANWPYKMVWDAMIILS